MPPTNANPLGNAANNSTTTTTASQKDGVRPPLYNPEDYCGALRALFTSSLTLHNHHHAPPPSTSLILEQTTIHSIIPGQGLIDMKSNNTKQSQHVPEMSMKKFINGSELLFKLESDLRSAFPSFVQEFVSGESDGVTCILDALRNIHEALDNVQGLREQRKLVLDERSCVQCVGLMMKNIDAIPKLLAYAHGLYPVVHCTVSTNTSTRVLALEILTNVCEQGGGDAYAKVSEAISTLRLRLGEPIRCKVLVGAISSAAAGNFQATGIRFLKTFIASAPSAKYRVYLQVELEEAGFNVDVIRKSAELSPARESRLVLQELDEWDRVCVDVDTVVRQNSQLRNSVATLQQEIATLKDKIKKSDSSSQSQHYYNQTASSATTAPPQSNNHVQEKKFTKKKHTPRNLSCTTPINHITTPVDSEEEAEQIHQILEDLHNIVNNEMLHSNDSSTTTTTTTTNNSEIVPVLNTRAPLLQHHHHFPRYNDKQNSSKQQRPVRSEPNLFESETSTAATDLLNSDTEADSPSVKRVVQQLENSNVFSTLPNFNTNLASKFANFRSSKLLDGGINASGSGPKGWGCGDNMMMSPLLEVENNGGRTSSSGGFRVKSLENLDNFTLKWRYPVPEKLERGGGGSSQNQQPNSLMVLQDYRMNRFSGKPSSSNNKQGGGSSSSSSPIGVAVERNASSSGGGGLFNKKKNKKGNSSGQQQQQQQQQQQVHSHPQKTFQISLLTKNNSQQQDSNKVTNLSYNDLGGGNNSGSGGGGGGGSSPSLLERVTDLPSGLY